MQAVVTASEANESTRVGSLVDAVGGTQRLPHQPERQCVGIRLEVRILLHLGNEVEDEFFL